MLDFLQDPTIWISLTAATAGGAYAIRKYTQSKNRVDNASPASPVVDPVPAFRQWEPLNPYAEILEVRGNHTPNHVTVVYGIRNPDGDIIPDHKLITCIHIPSYLTDAGAANGPITEVISPLPEGWREYLLSRPETRLIT